MSKQDRQGARTPADLVRRYNFGQSFAEAMGLASSAKADAKSAKETALEALRKAEAAGEAPTQEEIFNILTNNGTVQGIYRDDKGNIYVNASYIKSGTLLADLLKAGVLQSLDGETFYLDLEKGILRGKFSEFSISGKTVDSIANDAAQGAQENAEKYADTAAGNAQTNAEKYADAAAGNAQLNAQNYADAAAGNAQTNAEKYANDAAAEAQRLAEAYAKKIAQMTVEEQTQREIFDKLTGGGVEQGIYLKDGKIYINATFMQTGFLSSDLIRAGVIRSQDYEVVTVEKIYPGTAVFPGAQLYPNNGGNLTRGMEIDFGAGVIRGVFFYDETEKLDKRIRALEEAVFH